MSDPSEKSNFLRGYKNMVYIHAAYIITQFTIECKKN